MRGDKREFVHAPGRGKDGGTEDIWRGWWWEESADTVLMATSLVHRAERETLTNLCAFGFSRSEPSKTGQENPSRLQLLARFQYLQG